jgi:hypothetical protein
VGTGARITRAVLIGLVLTPVCCIGLGLLNNTPWAREAARRRAEAVSFQVLARAQTPDELDEAVDYLGVVLHTRDGGWVAVRYRDTHAGPIWSSAVARDSGGRWFVSSQHFCGRFLSYRQRKEQGKPTDDTELAAIERCDTLDAARELLIGLGFGEADPPAPDGAGD